MNALISGRAGLALVVDGPRLATIHAADPGVMVDRQPSEFRWLVGEAQDFEPFENVSPKEIADQLLQAQDREDGLQLALILLDPEMSDDIRSEAAQELEELLGDQELLQELEGVLYAEPLPEPADAVGGLALARAAAGRAVVEFLERLAHHQPAIREVREAWHAIP